MSLTADPDSRVQASVGSSVAVILAVWQRPAVVGGLTTDVQKAWTQVAFVSTNLLAPGVAGHSQIVGVAPGPAWDIVLETRVIQLLIVASWNGVKMLLSYQVTNGIAVCGRSAA